MKPFLIEDISAFRQFAARTWEDVLNLKSMLLPMDSEYGYAFRGQSDPLWTLQPTLERPDTQVKLNGASACEFEKRMLNQEMGSPETSDMTELEVLASQQHFGNPTRLLDFTLDIDLPPDFRTRR